MVLPVVIIAFADCVNHFNNLIMANALTRAKATTLCLLLSPIITKAGRIC
ncbi:hypothetical protein AO373_0472 [Moraxella catarrhalis]|nr:hypothetical protein AO380_1393 [Moraxella catarrhalis]OAV07445.1 hypothetical protein AO379_0074 [Moraxella catarrhalis]OAV10673.1 hypothetical protein AO378_0491 [Moraxella catarrhalis]OAV15242.1 hypothetical protein AO376_0433 [Moraxella catarrhalis]OAV19484.1 hypothetical protein AO373_0472 [Moraxella catarrhalis]